jgi:hypothetical protein
MWFHRDETGVNIDRFRCVYRAKEKRKPERTGQKGETEHFMLHKIWIM